jgi:hypothetical protein
MFIPHGTWSCNFVEEEWGLSRWYESLSCSQSSYWNSLLMNFFVAVLKSCSPSHKQWCIGGDVAETHSLTQGRLWGSGVLQMQHIIYIPLQLFWMLIEQRPHNVNFSLCNHQVLWRETFCTSPALKDVVEVTLYQGGLENLFQLDLADGWFWVQRWMDRYALLHFPLDSLLVLVIFFQRLQFRFCTEIDLGIWFHVLLFLIVSSFGNGSKNQIQFGFYWLELLVLTHQTKSPLSTGVCLISKLT